MGKKRRREKLKTYYSPSWVDPMGNRFIVLDAWNACESMKERHRAALLALGAKPEREQMN